MKLKKKVYDLDGLGIGFDNDKLEIINEKLEPKPVKEVYEYKGYKVIIKPTNSNWIAEIKDVKHPGWITPDNKESIKQRTKNYIDNLEADYAKMNEIFYDDLSEEKQLYIDYLKEIIEKIEKDSVIVNSFEEECGTFEIENHKWGNIERCCDGNYHYKLSLYDEERDKKQDLINEVFK